MISYAHRSGPLQVEGHRAASSDCVMSKNREHPVFFDPDNKRWPRLRGGVYLSGLALTLLFGILIFSILVSPALMPLQFAEQPAAARVPPPDPKIETAQQRRLRLYKQQPEA